MGNTTFRFFKQQLASMAREPRADFPHCPVKLNQNESPWDWPATLKQAVLERAREAAWNRYPPRALADFTAKVARFYGVSPVQVLVGHGSYELIYTAFAATLEPGRKALIPQPAFGAYAQFAALFGAEVITAGLNPELQFDPALLEAQARGADVVVLASPNNPTGAVIDPTDLEHLVQATTALWIVDEAYFDFHGESAIELARSCPNLVVLRTFSKGLSAAGLRFGAMICHPTAAPLFAAARIPYSVGVLSMAAVEVAMEHAGTLRGRLDEVKRERERVSRLLRAMDGVKTYPSRANFLLFETALPAAKLWQALVGRGVLVRDVSSQQGLEHALRVTIGRPEENDAFLRALEGALKETPA